MTWDKLVAQFTEAAAEEELPTAPKALSRKNWAFLKKMITDELSEVDQAFADFDNQITQVTEEGLQYAYDSSDLIAEQADGMIDMIYYILDCARKHGISLDPIMELVHSANMTKVDPETGKCRRDTDPTSPRFGKILKPVNFKAPNIKAEVNRQSAVGFKIVDTPDFDINQPLLDLQNQLKSESETEI